MITSLSYDYDTVEGNGSLGGRGGNSRGGVRKEGWGGKETAKVRRSRERGVLGVPGLATLL